MAEFFYCKCEGLHAVVEGIDKDYAIYYFVSMLNEDLDKKIEAKNVECEPVNVYFPLSILGYPENRRTQRAPDEGYCAHDWSFPPKFCPVCNKRVPLIRLRG